MTHVAYLAAGYGVTAGVLAAYAAWIVRRRRALLELSGAAPDTPQPGR